MSTDAERAEIGAEISYVEEKALEVYTPEGVKIWLDGRNRLLDGRTPRQAIQDGDTSKVIDVLEALAEGVFM